MQAIYQLFMGVIYINKGNYILYYPRFQMDHLTRIKEHNTIKSDFINSLKCFQMRNQQESF